MNFSVMKSSSIFRWWSTHNCLLLRSKQARRLNVYKIKYKSNDNNLNWQENNRNWCEQLNKFATAAKNTVRFTDMVLLSLHYECINFYHFIMLHSIWFACIPYVSLCSILYRVHITQWRGVCALVKLVTRKLCI